MFKLAQLKLSQLKLANNITIITRQRAKKDANSRNIFLRTYEFLRLHTTMKREGVKIEQKKRKVANSCNIMFI